MSDPFSVLGLDVQASASDVRDAHRALAKVHHPDAGGDDQRMREINAAAAAALRVIAVRARERDDAVSPTPEAPPTPSSAAARGAEPHRVGATRFNDLRRDEPSVVGEALPVETFESLLIVASWFGEVIDDDPPYRLDVRLAPIEGFLAADTWCRLDLVPDAGASTVSLAVATPPGEAPADVDVVRDLWVHALNELDWTDRR